MDHGGKYIYVYVLYFTICFSSLTHIVLCFILIYFEIIYSAFHLSAEGTYSYGRLTVYNETTLRWQVVIAEEERVVDDLMLVQMNGHGKRGL